ncbi:MAG: hypothetical protein HYV63_09930 [Candidatus Schekmanbacteria bacterium]|nr:hypothetical protein [Candidatus Schekmanbacteria bacterium]
MNIPFETSQGLQWVNVNPTVLEDISRNNGRVDPSVFGQPGGVELVDQPVQQVGTPGGLIDTEDAYESYQDLPNLDLSALFAGIQEHLLHGDGKPLDRSKRGKESDDADGDGFSNTQEMGAGSDPGDASDTPMTDNPLKRVARLAGQAGGLTGAGSLGR